jgi:hypothetical protein
MSQSLTERADIMTFWKSESQKPKHPLQSTKTQSSSTEKPTTSEENENQTLKESEKEAHRQSHHTAKEDSHQALAP